MEIVKDGKVKTFDINKPDKYIDVSATTATPPVYRAENKKE